MPGIIALRFCSAIRKTITRNRVPKRIRRPRSIETNAHRVSIDRFTQTRYIFLRMLAVTSIRTGYEMSSSTFQQPPDLSKYEVSPRALKTARRAETERDRSHVEEGKKGTLSE